MKFLMRLALLGVLGGMAYGLWKRKPAATPEQG